MRIPSSPRPRLRLACLLPLVVLGAACADESDADSTQDELQLEQTPISTGMKELRAGAPYVPGIDEMPLGGGATCLPNAKVQVRGGGVASSASIVHSRSNLNVEMGLDATGMLPVLGGLTGAASLAAKTTFDSRSASVLFQAAGTYESSLTTDTTPANFDMGNLAKCGFGYITKAQHKVAAALVVTMHSNSSNIDLKVSAGANKAGVAGSPPIADVKASLTTIIQKGNVEVSLHFATDVVPNIPAPPFAEAALVVGDDDAGKASALQKIDASLSWLANASNAINTYLVALQSSQDGTGGPPAPATTINFRYYPNTPPEVRAAVEATAKNASASRKNLADVDTIINGWETYKKAAQSGQGFEWNIAADPTDTVDALTARATDYLDTSGGKLRNYESSLSDDLEACSLVLRNDPPVAAPADLVTALNNKCKGPAAMPVDRAKLLVRPISAGTVAETTGGQKCDSGYRLPQIKELKIFNAWSMDRKSKSEGLWTDDSPGCTFGFPWINAGKVECSGILPHTGLSICVPTATGPLPSD
jgi:hypothetical protein